MGINALNNTAQEIITGVSGGVTAGDLVMNTEGGYLAACSSALGVAGSNNTTAGASAIRAITTVEGVTSYDINQSNPTKRICELGNGNIALVYSGQGTSPATNLNLRIRNVHGADAIARVTLIIEDIGCCRVAKLDSTRFVVAWIDTSSVLKFMVLNNDGTTAVAATTVVSTNSYYPNNWCMAVNLAGEVVLCYDKMTSRDFAFKRYSASGVLQGAETVIESATATTYPCVLGLADGGWVAKWYRSQATQAWKFARYNASGVLQGSVVTILASTNNLSGGESSNGLAQLTGGNLVMAAAGSANGYPDLYVYTSTGTLVKFIDNTTAISGLGISQTPQIMPLPSGGFASAYAMDGSDSHIRTYDASGAEVSSFSVTGFSSASPINYGSGVWASYLGFGYAVLLVGDNGANMDVKIAVCDTRGTLIGSVVVLRANAAGSSGNTSCILHSSGIFCFAYKDTISPWMVDGYYNTARSSVLGVAAETKAKDQTVRVLTNGTYPINQAMASGGSFDNTAATVPGAKGAVVGNTAILRGTK